MTDTQIITQFLNSLRLSCEPIRAQTIRQLNPSEVNTMPSMGGQTGLQEHLSRVVMKKRSFHHLLQLIQLTTHGGAHQSQHQCWSSFGL